MSQPTRSDGRALLRGPPIVGVAVAALLMFVAWLIPAAWNWDVHMRSWPPLHAYWDPRVGPGTIPAILIAVLGVVYAARFAQTASWRLLLLGTYGGALAWLSSLALVDGNDGIGVILNTQYEYLRTANTIHSWSALSTMLHEYVARIDADNPQHWPTHIAGHPPGAVLFFIALVALGLTSGLAAGWAVIIVSSTTAVAVLQTLRVLGHEEVARRAAPFLVLGPAAIWMAVSADAVFGTVAAWGTCCLAVAATRSTRWATAWWAVLAGLLLGYCVLMSYGLALLAFLALAVLLITRRWSLIPWVAGAGLAVMLAFYAAGFAWWDGLPALHVRQFRGVAASRPQQYYLWGNLAALAWSAGPVMYAGLAMVVARRWSSWREVLASRSGALASTRVVALLSLAGVAMVLGADVSGASRGEVERIWLPFVPWLLLGTALLPPPWRRVGLVLQVSIALLAQHFLHPDW